MKYLGSKRRIAKHIMPIILASRKPDQLYVEPMVGGANSFEHAANPRLGADANPYLIACLQAVSEGWKPPTTVTEQEYNAIKENKDAYPPELVGFVGMGCSFGAKWWGGYARSGRHGVTTRSHAKEAYNLIMRQAPKLRGAQWAACSYDALPIPNGALVYCDPPYAATTGYKGAGGEFDHAAFWAWACDISARCTVFVSEYTAPPGWECVWALGQTTNIDNRKPGAAFRALERLFVPAHQLRPRLL